MATAATVSNYTGVLVDAAQVTLHHGDCLDVLRTLPAASVDAVVTDPPYEIAFMSRTWDSTGIAYNVDLWRECLRVLRPGGYVAAFGGTRTYHRMACAVEDAGFEIRDSLSCSTGAMAWYYGSGFPKSRAVSRDPQFCQCVPGLRDAATDHAAESAAEVLLADLLGSGQEDAAHISDLHGLSVDVHPDYAPPGSSEQDVLADVRGKGDQRGEAGSSTAATIEDADDHLRGMREEVRDGRSVGEARQESDVLTAVQREGSRAVVDAVLQSGSASLDCGEPRVVHGQDDRGEQPGLARRRDVQAPEGQLRRPEVRPLPTGAGDDGPLGRLHHGAQARDGALGRPSADAQRVREPHRPQPAEQRQVEPGAVSDERGPQARRGWPLCPGCGKPRVPAGLGTALKPAWEPIVLARKPLGESTVASNVLTHGTGALNVDVCRVAADDAPAGRKRHGGGIPGNGSSYEFPGHVRPEAPSGRWPANVLLSHGACDDSSCEPGCPVAELDGQSGTRKSSGVYGGDGSRREGEATIDFGGGHRPGTMYADSGGASRFFPVFRYQAKAPASERPKVNGIAHPTCKPRALMSWLVRLVTPPGGTVLDPFAGSGTTLEAALLEGFHVIGIEREADYLPLIRHRIDRARATLTAAGVEPDEPGLFDVPA